MAVRPFDAATFDPDSKVVTPRGIPNGLSAFCPHNWEDAPTVLNFWPAETTRGQIVGAEQRMSLQPRPTRSVTTSHKSMTYEGTGAMYLEQFLQQSQAHTVLPVANEARLRATIDLVWQVPLIADQRRITGIAGTKLIVPGAHYRRFYVGQRVFLYPSCDPNVDMDLPGNYGVNHSTAEIASVATDGITLVALPTIPPQGGWTVAPSIDCLRLAEMPETVITDGMLQASVEAQEYNGASTLPPSIDPASEALTGWQAHTDGRYILDKKHNFKFDAGGGYARSTTEVSSGLGAYTNQDEVRAKRYWQLKATDFDRAQFWAFLQFWDWHLGSTALFWFIEPKIIWDRDIVVASSTKIQARRRGLRLQFEQNHTDIAIYGEDGQLIIRSIDSITEDASGTWEVSFTDPLPDGTVPIRIRPAILARFGSREMQETWLTEDICDLDARITEVDSEKVVELL